MCACLLGRGRERGEEGWNATVAVHLRLGDVLDWPHYRTVRGCGRTNTTGCFYVHPLRFYHDVALPREASIALLVGDPYYRRTPSTGARHSLAYRDEVARILRDRGLRVAIPDRREGAAWREPEHDAEVADEDLRTLARARWLLPARGGGFDALAVRCARGRVLGRTAHAT